MFKNQLQQFAVKAGYLPPVYEYIREGPPHKAQFKAILTVNNVKYESPPGFKSLRKAEHAAAKLALESLAKGQNGSVVPSLIDSGLCKNLLQEYTQKLSLPLPIYRTCNTGDSNAKVFTCTVEVAGKSYEGAPAKSKKEAEINAAKSAMLSIQADSQYAPEVPVFAVTKDPVEGGAETDVEGEKKRRKLCEVLPAESSVKMLKVKQETMDGDTKRDENLEFTNMEKNGNNVVSTSSISAAGESGVNMQETLHVSDVKPAFLEIVPSSVEIPGLGLDNQPGQQLQSSVEQEKNLVQPS